MLSRRLLLSTALAAATLPATLPMSVQADEPLKVVATFSILGDIAGVIGGDAIEVTTLVGPNGDAHVYQPTPKAAQAISEADLLITNGLEFEGWLDRLTEAADFNGKLVVATDGVEAIAYDDHDDNDDHEGHKDHDDHEGHKDHDDHGHDDHDDHAEHKHDDHDHEEHDHEEHAHDEHGHDDAHKHDDHGHDEHAHDGHDDHGHDDHKDEDHAGHDDHHGHNHGAFDPHAWQSIRNAMLYVDNITNGLAQADPNNASAYFTNRAAYVAELEALEAEVSETLATLPADRRTVVTSHDAFQYFARDYGLTFMAPQGLSTESEASARDVAEMITFIREEGIAAVFVENIADSRLLEQIATETGATIGGTLYPGALSGPDGPAPTYLDMMRHNATTIASALGS